MNGFAPVQSRWFLRSEESSPRHLQPLAFVRRSHERFLFVADKVSVTRQTIGMIEVGNYNPTLNLCIAICKALDKTLDDLFWADDQTEMKS